MNLRRTSTAGVCKPAEKSISGMDGFSHGLTFFIHVHILSGIVGKTGIARRVPCREEMAVSFLKFRLGQGKGKTK